MPTTTAALSGHRKLPPASKKGANAMRFPDFHLAAPHRLSAPHQERGKRRAFRAGHHARSRTQGTTKSSASPRPRHHRRRIYQPSQ